MLSKKRNNTKMSKIDIPEMIFVCNKALIVVVENGMRDNKTTNAFW